MRIEVPDTKAGERLDSFLSSVTGISRSSAQREIEDGKVLVLGETKTKKYQVKQGDIIEYTVSEPEEYNVTAENIPLDIIYEDSDIIVINKPKGMVVHPAAGNYSRTLVNALLYHCKDSLSGIGGVMRPGIVHRIDKDTSGLLVVAKNDSAHTALSDELSYHGITREYHAIVIGGFREESGTVCKPIGRHPQDRKRMAVYPDGDTHSKPAVTHYQVLATYSLPGIKFSYLKLRLETGRTHQIRVHMSSIGHPLLGDTTYGGGKSPFEKHHSKLMSGQTLHAAHLALTHPKSGKRMDFECPLPEYFSELLKILGKLNI